MKLPPPPARNRRIVSSADRLLSCLVGLILLSASGLKLVGLADSGSTISSIQPADPGPLHAILAVMEALFGLWLLLGRYRVAAWYASLVCFGLFSAFSLHKAVSGYTTCGCFGLIEIDPLYTFLFDLCVIFALFVWRPAELRPLHVAEGRGVGACRRWLYRRGMGLSASLLAAATLFGYLNWTSPPIQNSLLGTVVRGPDGKPLINLEPNQWIDATFPLLPYIDHNGSPAGKTHRPLAQSLLEGTWTVVVYTPDCRDCQVFLEELHANAALRERYGRVVTLELPPYGPDPRFGHDHAPWRSGRLRDAAYYFVKTPLVVTLQNGIVRSVRIGSSRDVHESAIASLLGV